MYYKLTGTVQKVDYTASAANSSAISDQVRYVRLYATTDCHISISNPAVTAGLLIVIKKSVVAYNLTYLTCPDITELFAALAV